ncbi:MAG: beta-hydroxyacyl-ACP dehydratase [Desulfobacteraceae bacterium]|nr:MAG: beta-hydroxyacyl-ACP dehydratase [Desulfobacteraceae bacterium]
MDKLHSIVGGKSGHEVIGYDGIRRILPQKEPFIFLDRVLELDRNKRILCLKNISGNDPWFCGHFPTYAVLPGALVCEAIAQAAVILVMKSYPHLDRRIGMFSSIKARFLRAIVPGDQLLIESHLDKIYLNTPVPSGLIHGEARVNNERVIVAHMAFGMVDQEPEKQE